MAIVLGLDAKLLRGDAGATGATEVKNVKDLTLNLESGDADVTTRATGGWRASAATLKEASLEFGILYDTEDADFQAFQEAYSAIRRSLFLSRTGTAAVLTPTGSLPLLPWNSLLRKPFPYPSRRNRPHPPVLRRGSKRRGER